MIATHIRKEFIWLHQLCSEIGFGHKAMNINCDSQRKIFMEKNPAYHSKRNHIYVQYHFMRDMVETKKVLLEKVDTLENIENSLTNSMSVVKFSWCREEVGIVTLGM
jgi:hypothetical protein